MNTLIRRENKDIKVILIKILLISILVSVVVYLVYMTGGTKKVFVHLMYIPIILSSLFWGPFSGVVMGIVCGILVGPFIPLDVSNGIMQEPINWISRLLIFSLIGFITGHMISRINKLNLEREERNLKSPFYDLPNLQKLLHDIEDRIKLKENFRLISIKLTNLQEIEKYIDNKLVFDIVENLAGELMHCCDRKAIYSYEKDELILFACENCVGGYEEKIQKVLDQYFAFPVSMNGYKIRVSLKVGIYVYKGEESSPIGIYNKARIAYEQGEAKESGIYYYDGNLKNKRREIQDITAAILESIERNELYVVYQPKIDIINNEITGVEALVRWKRNGNEIIKPDIFIPIAEEIGFITRISKFVFDNITTQMRIWESKGMDIKCSINTSMHDLLEDNYISWAKDIIDNKKVNESDIEIEITERVIAYDDQRLIDKMVLLKEKGHQISIDDFGTGYNSLKSIGEIPFDKLKIDKYFISRIDRAEIAELIKNIIKYAHTFEKIVIAEGVETQEQLSILKKLKCDEVQGYYYSKPLLPEELESFYINYNKDKELTGA